MSEIGKQLRTVRQSSGKTQAEIAAHLNLSRSTVVQMECGKRRVTAEDVERLAVFYQCSPTTLLSGPQVLQPDCDGDLLADLVQSLPDLRDDHEQLTETRRVLAIARTLTDLEQRLCLDSNSLGTHAYDIGTPNIAWEAMEQGFQSAEEERRRLNLGDAPIRDLDHTLVMKRIRMTKIDLPKDVTAVFVNSQETGFLVIVNRRLPIEARRFHYAHGFGHSLFDRSHRSFVCSARCRHDFIDVRASAFANGFLLPESSLGRYLESLGKEVRGRTGGVEVNLFSEPGERVREAMNLRVTGRNRRGAEPINVCDLAQIASFFGVSRSMVATRLRNLRYVTAAQFESLDELDAQGVATTAHEAMALTDAQVESEHDAFRSRLVALAVTGMDCGVCDRDEFVEITELLGLREAQRQTLIGTIEMSSKERRTGT